MTTVSKLWSSNSSAWASPIRRSTSRPRSLARLLPISSISRLSSIPVNANAGAVVREVAPGTEGDLEHVPLGLRASPFAPAGEQGAIEEPHVAVVARRLLVLKATDALGLGDRRVLHDICTIAVDRRIP